VVVQDYQHDLPKSPPATAGLLSIFVTNSLQFFNNEAYEVVSHDFKSRLQVIKFTATGARVLGVNLMSLYTPSWNWFCTSTELTLGGATGQRRLKRGQRGLGTQRKPSFLFVANELDL
jgi:hypothetical protein